MKKKVLNKIKQFKLTTPVAIIIASVIFSFHYVWINKYEFVSNKHGKTSFTVINKWTGKACMTSVDLDDIDKRAAVALCESDDFEVVFPFNHDFDLP